MIRKKIFVIIVMLIIDFGFYNNILSAENLERRFKGAKNLVYDVSFNGFKVGTFNWQYLGKDKFAQRDIYILLAKANTNIIGIFDLLNEEKIFLDRKTFLPLKVERQVSYFGKKEILEEFYNQDKGLIRVVEDKNKDKILQQDKPINNILTLMYFFPKDIELKEGSKLYFNLPTQKLSIDVVSDKEFLITPEGKKEAYFLVGKGNRDFRIWLDKKDRLPLRLDSTSFLGRVVIAKQSKSNTHNN